MEDVLELYQSARDPSHPLVCLDELPVQFFGEVAAPLPPRPGSVAKQDYEYIRNGSGSVFMAFAPLEGKRLLYVAPGATRTGTDYARFLRMISEHWTDAHRITLVQDNLNTHNKGSLYATFPAAEARKLARHFDFHFTPKHASWLNVAESEISIFARQCLNRRLRDEKTLRHEAKAWEHARNATATKARWQFTTADARIKLKSLYPQFD